MKRLALDLGTNCGFAAGDESLVVSGVQSFKNDRYSGGGMRYLRFQRWLDETHAAMGFTEVVFEEVRNHNGNDAAHVYGGLLGILTAWCEAREIPYEGVTVGEIKKFATGRGDAPKDDVEKDKRNKKVRANNAKIDAGTAKPGTKRRKEYVGLTMVSAVRSWGYEPQDDNEADALALLHCKLGFKVKPGVDDLQHMIG